MSHKVPNEDRGEYTIVIGGEEFIIRYPLGAVKVLDQKFKGGFQKKLERDEFNSADIGYVIFLGLKYGGNEFDEDTVLDMLDMAHFADYIEVLEDALGGKKMQAKVERDTAKAMAAIEERKKKASIGESG